MAALSTKTRRRLLPTHVDVGEQSCLDKHSIAFLEQIRTIDKSRLIDHIGSLDSEAMSRIDEALAISIGLMVS